MSRPTSLLKVKGLPHLAPGSYSDGGGLYFVVSDKGKRTWMLRGTEPGTTKRAESKLGDYPEMTLEEARRERDRRRDKAKLATPAPPLQAKVDRDMTVKVVAEMW